MTCDAWAVCRSLFRMGASSWIFRGLGARRHSAALICFVTLGLRAVAGPRLACQAPIHYFGTLTNDQVEIEASFGIRNDGDAAVAITADPMGCGCTVAALPTNVLGVGEQTTLRVKISMRGRRGPIMKRFMIRAQPPHSQTLLLGFEGTVDVPVELVPEQFAFGVLDTNAASSLSSTVSFHIRRPDRILGCNVDSPHFTAGWSELRPNRQYQLDVRTVPNRLESNGQYRAVLYLHTDRRGSNAIAMPIAARVCSDELVVSPERMGLPSAFEQPLTLYAMLTRRGTNLLEVLDVRSPRVDLRIRILRMSGNSCRIDIGGIRDTAGLVGTCVRIRTNVPGQEQVEIPIDGPTPQ